MRKDLSSITLKEIFYRTASKFPVTKKLLQKKIQSAVQKSQSRERLNAEYNNLNYYEKAIFHSLFSKLFRDNPLELEDGIWQVKFLNEQIKLPLNSQSAWLDWDTASAVTGHDIDVKITYETLLKSEFRPKVFFDVGANYGTHSLLFLSQKVKTISFEPNPHCHQNFKNYCQLNNFTETLEGVAVSDAQGEVELCFPEKDTWLGTIVSANAKNLDEKHLLEKSIVPLITLDDYVERTGLNPDLIKIDTEGNEFSVLNGAFQTLQRTQPLVIFESNQTVDADEKEKIYAFFEQLNFSIVALPVLPDMKHNLITLKQMRETAEGNFLAVHNEHRLFRARF